MREASSGSFEMVGRKDPTERANNANGGGGARTGTFGRWIGTQKLTSTPCTAVLAKRSEDSMDSKFDSAISLA
jgi:hypothetical protein